MFSEGKFLFQKSLFLPTREGGDKEGTKTPEKGEVRVKGDGKESG